MSLRINHSRNLSSSYAAIDKSLYTSISPLTHSMVLGTQGAEMSSTSLSLQVYCYFSGEIHFSQICTLLPITLEERRVQG